MSKEIQPQMKEKILEKILDVLQHNQAPFRNVIFLNQGNVLEVLEVPDGWEKGALTVNIEGEAITASLTWTYFDARDDDEEG